MKLTVAIDRTIGRTIYRWHLHLYRWTRGVIGHKSPLGPMLILETRGRISGRTRSVTLLFYAKSDLLYVVASNGGRPGHPEWLLNLRSDPHAVVQVGANRFDVLARELPSSEQPDLWRELVAQYRGWGHYQRITERTISAVELQPNPKDERPS